MLLQHPLLHLRSLIALLFPELTLRSSLGLKRWSIWFNLRHTILLFHALSIDSMPRRVTLCNLFPCVRLFFKSRANVDNHIWWEYHSPAGGMGTAAARALTLQRVQLFGSPHLTHTAIYTRQLSSGLQVVPALTRSSNINRKFVTVRSNLADSCKSFNISTAMDSSINTNGFIVTRASMKPSFGSPRADLNLGSHGFSRGLASAAVSRDSESAASTSDSSAHQEKDPRPKEEEKKSSRGLGVFAIGAGIFSTILSYIIKLCGGGYTPFIKQAEKDIDKVADFVGEGARLVVKVADEIEEIAHAADLSAQEAEDLALKVEAKTKVVKETLDAIADVLEGDKKLSTVLTDYADLKKETTETTKGS